MALAGATAVTPFVGSSIGRAATADTAQWNAVHARYRAARLAYDAVCDRHDRAEEAAGDAQPRIARYFDEYQLGMHMKRDDVEYWLARYVERTGQQIDILKTADEFTADGWFKTGDVGRVDVAGYTTIVGRSKDLIITGGYNVYPAEIEASLNELPGVAESAVIGVPHADFGEAVVAVVVAKPGALLDAAAMAAALKTRIANFKVPKRVFIVTELPRNAMGKVQKKLLREQHQTLFT